MPQALLQMNRASAPARLIFSFRNAPPGCRVSGHELISAATAANHALYHVTSPTKAASLALYQGMSLLVPQPLQTVPCIRA